MPNSVNSASNSPSNSANSASHSANSPSYSSNSPRNSPNSPNNSANSPSNSANSPTNSANSPSNSANSGTGSRINFVFIVGPVGCDQTLKVEAEDETAPFALISLSSVIASKLDTSVSTFTSGAAFF